jgi:hypothetical protein
MTFSCFSSQIVEIALFSANLSVTKFLTTFTNTKPNFEGCSANINVERNFATRIQSSFLSQRTQTFLPPLVEYVQDKIVVLRLCTRLLHQRSGFQVIVQAVGVRERIISYRSLE